MKKRIFTIGLDDDLKGVVELAYKVCFEQTAYPSTLQLQWKKTSSLYAPWQLSLTPDDLRDLMFTVWCWGSESTFCSLCLYEIARQISYQ